MFSILFFHLAAAIVDITGALRTKTTPKETMLESKKMTPSLLGLLFLYSSHCKFGFLYVKSKSIHSGLQFFVMIPFNTV